MVEPPRDMNPDAGHQERNPPAERARLEDLFVSLIDQAMPDALFIHDHAGRFLMANARARASLGYTREELLTMSVADVEQDFDLAAAQAVWNRLEPGFPMILRGRLRRKDGSAFPVEVHLGLMEGNGERLFIGIVRDISERERAEQALSEREAQYRALLDASSDVVYRMGPDWKEMHLLVGKQFIADTTEPSRTWLSKYIHPDDQAGVLAAIDEAIRKKEPFKLEHRVLRPDGTFGWTFSRAVPVLDAHGEIEEWIGMASDITERKREESEAQKHSELMQSLARQQVAVQTAAAFAHELNQPLVSITAYNEVALRALRNGGEKSDQLVRAIAGSHEQALRAGRVLHELIDHLHKGEAEPAPFDINDLVKEVVEKVRKTAFHGFQTRLHLEPGLPPVLGNRLQTEKVLANLIQNGVEAMEEAGVAPASFAIAVRTLAGRNMAHITLRDCGPGLDADAARRIFEPFFTTKPEGLGLGLAISRSLIEAQDGQLWVDPEDGPGAVFHFTLPFAHE